MSFFVIFETQYRSIIYIDIPIVSRLTLYDKSELLYRHIASVYIKNIYRIVYERGKYPYNKYSTLRIYLNHRKLKERVGRMYVLILNRDDGIN